MKYDFLYYILYLLLFSQKGYKLLHIDLCLIIITMILSIITSVIIQVTDTVIIKIICKRLGL